MELRSVGNERFDSPSKRLTETHANEYLSAPNSRMKYIIIVSQECTDKILMFY